MKQENFFSPEFGFNSTRYFSESVKPFLLKAGQKTITRPTRYEHHEHLEYVYIRSGSGLLYINNEIHPICTGDGMVFLNCHFHKFVPEDGGLLQIDYCRLSIGTFLYVLANPYLSRNALSLSIVENFVIAHFDKTRHARLEQIYDYLSEQYQALKKSEKINPLSYSFYSIELIGIYCDYPIEQ